MENQNEYQWFKIVTGTKSGRLIQFSLYDKSWQLALRRALVYAEGEE